MVGLSHGKYSAYCSTNHPGIRGGVGKRTKGKLDRIICNTSLKEKGKDLPEGVPCVQPRLTPY